MNDRLTPRLQHLIGRIVRERRSAPEIDRLLAGLSAEDRVLIDAALDAVRRGWGIARRRAGSITARLDA